MKVSAFIKLIENDGWYKERQKGGHAVYRHPAKQGILIVPMHGSKELAKGTEKSLRKKAGLL